MAEPYNSISENINDENYTIRPNFQQKQVIIKKNINIVQKDVKYHYKYVKSFIDIILNVYKI